MVSLDREKSECKSLRRKRCELRANGDNPAGIKQKSRDDSIKDCRKVDGCKQGRQDIAYQRGTFREKEAVDPINNSNLHHIGRKVIKREGKRLRGRTKVEGDTSQDKGLGKIPPYLHYQNQCGKRRVKAK